MKSHQHSNCPGTGQQEAAIRIADGRYQEAKSHLTCLLQVLLQVQSQSDLAAQACLLWHPASRWEGHLHLRWCL